MPTATEDFTSPLDRPSESTLQLIWQERSDIRAVELIKRPNIDEGAITKTISVVHGVQPYLHNHYYEKEFYKHDPSRGIITNPYGQRVMRVTEDFLVAILGSLEDQAGQNGAREMMYKCGFQWGMHDMKRFLPRMRAEFNAELDRMRVDFLMEQWWWPLTIQGWGTWRYDFRQRDKGLLYIELYESAVAQSIGDIGAVVCYFYAGLFASIFSVLAKRSLGSVEMQCYSTGDDHCKFVVSDYDRVNAAAFWRSEGATSREIMNKLVNM
jgi:predicted hydrocarbon binding protein